jgi:[ribosomal protein S5]-alanine N-acetyltransferase
VTARVRIRPPGLDDMPEFLRAVLRSGALHRPWVSAPATAQQYRAYLQRMVPPANYAFVVCRRDDGALVGVINLTNIVRGAFKSGYLGYYAFAGHQGQGLMREGLSLVVRHAFKMLRLHRLEANIQPHNAPSIALAKACGFRREGFSPLYLKIGGRWRDHERWAIVAGTP